ncbi:DNA translocase FtsK 4TM domain-containing protein [Candidatus Dojkabacteria bacterium]|nr:DNA translocase FtsK 4TM domain-containing protein [Candidatus Dojkabacteria bacterium]
MAKRGRPPKNRELTIKSDETRVFFALMLLGLGLLLLSSSFLSGEFFNQISKAIGDSTYVLGIFFMALSLRLFGYNNWFSGTQTLIGFFSVWAVSLPFLHFLLPIDKGAELADEGRGGGILGYAIHKTLYNWFDLEGEFIILVIIGLIAISVTTGISIRVLQKLVEKIFTVGGKSVSKVTETVGNSITQIKESTPAFGDDYVQEVGKLGELYDKQETRAEIGSKVDTKTEQTGTQPKPKSSDDSRFLYPDWEYPPISLLDPVPPKSDPSERNEAQAEVIEKTLRSFGISSEVVDINYGPTVVQYALKISVGIKVNKISNLSKDLALALAAPSGQVRIETPIPGTSFIGIEVPHEKPDIVSLRELMSLPDMKEDRFALPLPFGKNVSGLSIVRDLTKMPHMLIAGATGSGKSISINGFIMGLIMTLSPDQLRLILVDPKTVEFAPYADIPHLMVPVVTDVNKVVSALTWAVEEMQCRYAQLREAGTRNIAQYNEKKGYTSMPYIVVIIDEMADLMLSTGIDIEHKIVRLAQMARAVGIHLLLATQRPSVNVITGLIKANVPARIGMTVATSIDSRVILDTVGAETLLGNGDMLFKAPDVANAVRIQGVYTKNQEIERVVEFLKKQGEPVYNEAILEANTAGLTDIDSDGGSPETWVNDSVFLDAIKVVASAQQGSASYIQRKLRIGYNRAARYIDQMEEVGVVGPRDGSKPREVLITNADEFIERLKHGPG